MNKRITPRLWKITALLCRQLRVTASTGLADPKLPIIWYKERQRKLPVLRITSRRMAENGRSKASLYSGGKVGTSLRPLQILRSDRYCGTLIPDKRHRASFDSTAIG